MYLNPDHIICIEETPDTVITLFNGNRYIVIDRAISIISRVVAFRSRISRRAASPSVKKYLGRTATNPIMSRIDQSGNALTDNQGKHINTPFHSRDY